MPPVAEAKHTLAFETGYSCHSLGYQWLFNSIVTDIGCAGSMASDIE
jgi:hypothetical protein